MTARRFSDDAVIRHRWSPAASGSNSTTTDVRRDCRCTDRIALMDTGPATSVSSDHGLQCTQPAARARW
jgi:hypothetical protein